MNKVGPYRACCAALVMTACVRAPSATPEASPSASSTRDAATIAEASACDQLVSACHFNEPLGPLVHQCHTLSHDRNADRCEAYKDRCLSACREVEKRRATARHGPQPAQGPRR